MMLVDVMNIILITYLRGRYYIHFLYLTKNALAVCQPLIYFTSYSPSAISNRSLLPSKLYFLKVLN
jgi:hypothetical protein